MYKYTIEIFYSEEDEGYIAVVPELPGCSAFGETEEEALKEIKVAIKLWIEAAKKEGKEIPKPMEKAKFMMTEIVGVTYPIPKQFMDRFFRDGKDIFIKPATVWKQLKPGMKFVFYQSHEDTGFVGEAKVKRVMLSEDPMKFYET